jgi:hypothetical protein
MYVRLVRSDDPAIDDARRGGPRPRGRAAAGAPGPRPRRPPRPGGRLSTNFPHGPQCGHSHLVGHLKWGAARGCARCGRRLRVVLLVGVIF